MRIRSFIAAVAATTVVFAVSACTNGGKGNDVPSDGQTVTFDAGDGVFKGGDKSVTASISDGKVTAPKVDPVRDGHAFAGWYNKDGAEGDETEFDAYAHYTSGTKFTAKYVSGSADIVYDALFDEDSHVTIDMNMSDAEWKKLNQDYIDFEAKDSKSPIYRLADSVTIGIDDGDGFLYYYYEEVGVRMKGNTSRNTFYNDDGFFNSIHMKLSFKETFDDAEDGYKQDELKVWEDESKRDERKDRTFGGMEKIDVKYNSTADETYVRELYAMKLFRDNGIYAPNATLCSLTALEKDTTTKNLGVYRIHEPIDEAFISRHIEQDRVGDLYKCTYTKTGPANLKNEQLDSRVGVEDELKGRFYSYDKKTNKKKDKITGERDFSSIKNFIRAVDGNDADYEELIDTDYFAKFEAVNYILGNPDCIRNNYNNYYLYFLANGKAIVIPYDYDRCLGITKDWDPTGSANMYVTPYTRTIAANGNGQDNPLYVHLIDKGAPTGEGSVLMRYRQNLIDISASTALSATDFNAYKDKFKARYGKYTSTAIGSNGLAFDNGNTGNVPYATYIQTKLNTLNENIDNYNP